MIFVELEDLIVNILMKLYSYKSLRSVSGEMVKNCINTLDKVLKKDDKIFKITDRNNCMKNSHYFDVHYSNSDVEYILKEYITLQDLVEYNNLSSNIWIFKSDYFIKSLGIIPFKETSIDELLLQVLQDTTAFYFQIAGKLNEKEYVYIKNMLQNKKCENCIKINCENRYDVLVCDGWDNREIVGRCKILREYNVFNLKK